jgi:hypothetical protein
MVLGINTLDFRGGDPYSTSSLVFPLSMDGVTWTLPDASGNVMLAEQNLSGITNPTLARDALGSGTIGDELFTSETQEEAQAVLGILPTSIVEFYSGAGSINIPAEAKFVSFILIGGGGGGGSGSRGLSTVARSGGTGGTAGRWIAIPPIPISQLGGSASYVVGSGGAGGSSQTFDSLTGVSGSVGGNTVLTIGSNVISVGGGAGGLAGLLNSGTSSIGLVGSVNGTIGSAGLAATPAANGSLITGNSNPQAATATHYPTSGGPAGGIAANGTVFLGASGTAIGSNSYVVTGGLAGTSISPTGKNGNTTIFTRAGTGGGGAMTTSSISPGNRGGDGGLYGGGGGGGSPSVNGQPSGAGGNGAGGLVQVTFYY